MSVTDRDLLLDRELSQICGLIPLLRLVTPVNTAEAREDFLEGIDPIFEYRQLPDLDEIEARLGQLSSESADDAVIAHMAEGLIKDLKLRLEMLRKRDTEDFFLISVEMFGHVEASTLQLADEILANSDVPPKNRETVSAEEFASSANQELDLYRRDFPELQADIRISDTTSGVMVETGDLYIGRDTRIARSRVGPLIQHEVGTHILTYENGRSQPLHMLSVGLAGYDELQEALGVLAEHLSGRLPPDRLRVLAYRVVAAHMRGQNASFSETFHRLTEFGCSRRIAFSTTMRAYRSGGMTKDAIYLRGLVRLLNYLKEGGSVEELFVGKISFESIPLVAELMERGVLSVPPLRPRFLDMAGASQRLDEARNGLVIPEIGVKAS